MFGFITPIAEERKVFTTLEYYSKREKQGISPHIFWTLFSLNWSSVSEISSVHKVGPNESTKHSKFCTIYILLGFDDIKMWALLLSERIGELCESNVCFSHMNFTCGKSQVTCLQHNSPDKGWMYPAFECKQYIFKCPTQTLCIF